MDETTVREHAEAHGNAVVAGDLRRAGADLTEEAAAKARDVMAQLPTPTTSSEVVRVDASGSEYVVQTRYTGDAGETTVESRWAEREGRPKIVDLRVV